MSILERIDQDFKEAMKAREEQRLSALRLMRTALKNRQIDAGHSLSEPEVAAVLKTLLKQYQDALADFERAGRTDLADKQRAEIDLVAAYLPAALPAEEVARLVHEALAAADVHDFGKAMSVAMKAVDGRADGSVVREVVQTWLKKE